MGTAYNARVRTTLLAFALLAACSSGSNPPPGGGGSDLSGFAIETITVDGVPIEAWLAETPAQQAQGFMNASEAQLADLPDGTPRGMLFVFPAPTQLSFFMRDTFVALDLAHFRTDGALAETVMLAPLDETPVPSGQPVRYSLEVPAGTLAARGIGVGANLALPLP